MIRHVVVDDVAALVEAAAAAAQEGRHVVVFATPGLEGCVGQVVDRVPAAQLDALQDLHAELDGRMSRQVDEPSLLIVIGDDDPLTGCVREPIINDLLVHGPRHGIHLAVAGVSPASRRLVEGHAQMFTRIRVAVDGHGKREVVPRRPRGRLAG